MKTTIRIQAVRILCAYFLLALLCIWQSHFIIAGIEANPYLNLLIIGIFVFGSSISLLTVYNLQNDVIAYDALQSVYEEAKQRRFETPSRETLLAICLKPGRVYRSSQLLGPVFGLTMDELLRSREMRISVATMQNLISAIDARVAHHRSLSNYLTSLCIFLGLIGTFIGLMEMVGSVGGIIGGLANTEGNSSEVMKNLLKNLEGPLTGMAQGFSSSLFGLFGSLLLGLIARFTNVATHSIRENYEAWLAGVSQIESDTGENKNISVGQASFNPLLQRLGLALRSNTERMEQQIEIVERISRQLDRVARAEKQTLDGLAKIETVQNDVARLREDVSQVAQQQRIGMLDLFEQLARSAQEQHALAMSEISTLSTTQRQLIQSTTQLSATQDKLNEGLDKRHAATMFEVGKMGEAQIASQLRLDNLASAQSQAGERQDRDRNIILGAIEKLAATQSQVSVTLSSVAETQAKIAASAPSHDANILATMDRIAAAHEKTAQGLAALAEAQTQSERRATSRVDGLGGELARLTSIQEQANTLLIRVAAAQAAQPSQSTMTAIVTQSVSSSVAEIAQALDRSLQSLGHEVTRLAEEQNRTLAAMSASPEEVFKREMREMSRTLQNGISVGLSEVAQTLEASLATYSDVLRVVAETQADERQVRKV